MLPHAVQRTQHRYDIQACLWDLTNRTPGPVISHSEPTDQRIKDYNGGDGFKLEVVAVAFRPDSKAVATAANDGTIRFCDVVSGKPIEASIQQPDYTNWARGWQTPEWGDVPLAQFFNRHCELAYSPDGQQLLARGSEGGKLHCWDATTGRDVGYPLLANPRIPLRFDADGTVPTVDVKVLSYDTQAGGALLTESSAQMVAVPQGEPLAGALSPSGSLAVVGYNDGRCWLLDAKSRRPLGPPQRYDGPVVAITWSVDGHTIWTACADRALRSFRAPTAVPTDPELATVWIEVLTGYRFSLPKPPEIEVPLEKLTLRRGQQAVSAPLAGASEDCWRQQRKKLESAKP